MREVRAVHFAALRRAIEEATTGIVDPAAGLLAGCLAYCRYAVEQPGSYRILFASPAANRADSPASQSPGAAAFQTLVDGISECVAAGVARPGDPFRIATDVWPALHGIAALRQADVDFSWPPLDDHVRGILEAFTGIAYREAVASERSPTADLPLENA